MKTIRFCFSLALPSLPNHPQESRPTGWLLGSGLEPRKPDQEALYLRHGPDHQSLTRH